MNNNLKRFLGYFLHMVFVGFVLYWIGVYEHQFKVTVSYNLNWRLYVTVYPIILGMLLALPRFICTVRKPGQLYMDWVKFLGIGLPALYAAFFALGSPTLGNFLPSWVFLPGLKLFSFSGVPLTVFGIIFGYTLLNAVKKD